MFARLLQCDFLVIYTPYDTTRLPVGTRTRQLSFFIFSVCVTLLSMTAQSYSISTTIKGFFCDKSIYLRKSYFQSSALSQFLIIELQLRYVWRGLVRLCVIQIQVVSVGFLEIFGTWIIPLYSNSPRCRRFLSKVSGYLFYGWIYYLLPILSLLVSLVCRNSIVLIPAKSCQNTDLAHCLYL